MLQPLVDASEIEDNRARFGSPKPTRRSSGILTSSRRRPFSALAKARRTTSGGRSAPFAIALPGSAIAVIKATNAAAARAAVSDRP